LQRSTDPRERLSLRVVGRTSRSGRGLQANVI